jgi:hypothetical protein
MKQLNYTQNRPPGRLFDNSAVNLIVHWMQPLRLKAIRRFAAAGAVLLALVGCETDGETVPTRTSGLPAGAAEPAPILVAQADPAIPVKIDKPAAAADLSTNNPAALTTAEETAKAMAEVGATNAPAATTTNATPVISEEIPPARPANLKISDSTEKIIKLTESNLDEKVILTFVQQTPAKFELDADEIVYLSDVGVPSTVIAAMLKHDGDDPSKAENITAAANTENVQPAIPANTNLPPAIAQSQAPVQLPGAPEQQPIEVTTNYIPNGQVIAQQPPVVVQQPQTVVVEQPVVYGQPETVSYFYDSLSPYGSWFYVSDYGWCWQPTVAVIDHGWRPYGPRGHWVFTDSGWYWHSDYTWGWAPFHYGRWQMAGGRGWIWVPDRVWGPSWVTWRNSGDYCGWAPLPPHAVFRPGFGFTYFGRGVDISFGFGLGYDAFCFAPVGRFHNRHVYDYCLPRHEVVRVFPHSHVANRWEFRNDRREFVNRAGPRLENGVRPAVVRTMSDHDQNRWGNRERVERTSRETVIYRPPSPPSNAGSNIAGNGRPGTAPGSRGGNQNWTPRTRAEVMTRPSTTAGGIAAQASPPQISESRRPDRSPVVNRPSTINGSPAPTRAVEPTTASPATRDRAESVTRAPSGPRQITGTSPSGGTAPVASAPTTPAPTVTTPAPGTRSRVIQTPEVATAPTPARQAPEPRVINPQTRRPLADASSATTPLPGAPTFNNPARTTTTAEPAPSRREAFRTIPQPSTPAPQVSTPTPTITPQTVAPPPRTVAPPPQISSPPPRIISPPPSTPAPTRSAPTYSAPTYTPPMRGNVNAPAPAPISRAPAPVSRAPVTQAPVSRGGESRQAPSPNTVSPNRRGRD